MKKPLLSESDWLQMEADFETNMGRHEEAAKWQKKADEAREREHPFQGAIAL